MASTTLGYRLTGNGNVYSNGERGVQGLTGAQGAQGAQGVQGVQGVQGAIGFQGYQGTAGVDDNLTVYVDNELITMNLVKGVNINTEESNCNYVFPASPSNGDVFYIINNSNSHSNLHLATYSVSGGGKTIVLLDKGIEEDGGSYSENMGSTSFVYSLSDTTFYQLFKQDLTFLL